MHKYNVTLNKTNQTCHYFDKMLFFPYLNPTSYLNSKNQNSTGQIKQNLVNQKTIGKKAKEQNLNGGYKKKKHTEFSEKLTFLTP